MRFLLYPVIGAVDVGGLGLAAGIIGPIVCYPGANQGPLLGIFVLGPLGIIVGFVVGLVVAFVNPNFKFRKGV